jgi:putative membrane protein
MEMNMQRTLFRRAFSLAVIGGVCITAQEGLTAPKKAPPRTASEPVAARATSESNMSDGQILAVANAANDGEIALSSLASSKAQSEPVKQFALLMLKDHDAAKHRGLAVATKLRIKPSPSSVGNALQKLADDLLGRLEKTSSLDFDQIYMESQIRFLQRVLSILDELLPQTDSKELQALVADMREHAEQHLATARSTRTNH